VAGNDPKRKSRGSAIRRPNQASTGSDHPGVLAKREAEVAGKRARAPLILFRERIRLSRETIEQMISARAADQLVTSASTFDRAIGDHLPMIRRIAAAYESNASAREDLVQDILCALWRALPNFRGEGALRGFVARVAANRAVTHVQRALKVPDSAELTSDLAATDPGPEAHAMATGDRERLVAALRALPIGLREPALLALEGLTQQEIASVLGITPNAVAIRMMRAKSQLRKLMGDRNGT
jgi:RNA polymerase sigma factor (sigma-70 family)